MHEFFLMMMAATNQVDDSILADKIAPQVLSALASVADLSAGALQPDLDFAVEERERCRCAWLQPWV